MFDVSKIDGTGDALLGIYARGCKIGFNIDDPLPLGVIAQQVKTIAANDQTQKVIAREGETFLNRAFSIILVNAVNLLILGILVLVVILVTKTFFSVKDSEEKK
jgi:hypothetical protein